MKLHDQKRCSSDCDASLATRTRTFQFSCHRWQAYLLCDFWCHRLVCPCHWKLIGGLFQTVMVWACSSSQAERAISRQQCFLWSWRRVWELAGSLQERGRRERTRVHRETRGGRPVQVVLTADSWDKIMIIIVNEYSTITRNAGLPLTT